MKRIVFFEVQSWEKTKLIKAFPHAVFTNDCLSLENADKYKNAEIISTFIYSQLLPPVLNKLPRLKYITTRSTGYDHIDLAASEKRNILVSNVPEYGSRTVAEHTFGLILTLTRKIYASIDQVKEAYDFNRKTIRGIDLQGKTIGVVGLGKIGIEVVKLARGFNMNILVATRTQNQQLSKQYRFSYVSFNELISRSLIVTLHVPLTKKTYHMINKGNIGNFRKGSYLINTARGGLIETEAIMKGLKEHILEGAALDVLEEEDELSEEIDILTNEYEKRTSLKTLLLNHLLIKHPRVVITPHNAFNSKDALQRIVETTIENISSFLEKHPKNLVKSTH